MITIEGVIFAGGKGKRLLPLTQNMPKPLLIVGGKKLAGYSVEALVGAKIDNITLIINKGDQALFLEHFNSEFNYILSSGEENIFYLLYLLSSNLTADYVVFLDGDSYLDEETVSSCVMDIAQNSTFDVAIVTTQNSNSTTKWLLNSDSLGKVLDITSCTNSNPHCMIICKSESVKSFFSKVEQIVDLDQHKYENEFIVSYESYLLGWGLFIKLNLDLGYSIINIKTKIEFKNVNTLKDILDIQDIRLNS